jgi:hypothetical protein
MKYLASSLVLRAIAITHKKNVKCSARRASLATQIPSGNQEIRRIRSFFGKSMMKQQ